MNVVYFIIAFVFFLLGIFLFAFAFDVQGYQAVMFLRSEEHTSELQSPC